MKKQFFFLLSLMLVGVVFIGQNQAQTKPAKVRVGMTPITDYLQLYAAVDQGFFGQQGLDVDAVPIWRISQKLEAVAGGSLEITGISPPSFLMSKARGFDFIVVAAGVTEPKNPPFTNYMMVRKDSGINRWRDLAGKRIAVASTKSILDIYIPEAVRKDGGDPSKIRWVSIRFPAIGLAIVNRQVDAGAMVEPFVTPFKGNPEVKFLGDYFHEVRPGAMITIFAALNKWVKAHPGSVEKFARGMHNGIDWVEAHPAAARKLLLKYTRLKPGIVGKIGIKDFAKKVDVKELQWISDKVFSYGWIDKKQDVSQFIYRTAR